MVRHQNVSEHQLRLKFLFSALNFNGKPFYELPEQMYSFQLHFSWLGEQETAERDESVAWSVTGRLEIEN